MGPNSISCHVSNYKWEEVLALPCSQKLRNKGKNASRHHQLLSICSLSSLPSSFMPRIKKTGLGVMFCGCFRTSWQPQLILSCSYHVAAHSDFPSLLLPGTFPTENCETDTASHPPDQRGEEKPRSQSKCVSTAFLLIKLPLLTSDSLCMSQEKLKEQTIL